MLLHCIYCSNNYIHTYFHTLMRIRKRFPPPSFPSDLILSPPATSPLQLDPPHHPSHTIMGITTRWGPHLEIYNNEEKMKLIKESGDDETRKEEEKKSGNNDVRNITISYEQECANITIMRPSSSSADQQGDNYKLVVPLKKRKRNAIVETISSKTKSKTSKKWEEMHINEVDRKGQDCNNDSNGDAKKRKIRRNIIMEGSRCSRVNGRGWRCCQPTLVGYALCEHHLGKGRLRSMGSVRCREVGGGGHQELMIISTKRRKKARSLRSLLSQV